MSVEEKEKKNKRAGMIISGVTHIAVILLFIFLVAWRAPNPPLPEFGIELNFGTSDQGTGDTQPEPNTPPAETESEEDAPEEIVEEVVDEVVEETTEEVVEPVTETVEEVVEETTETAEDIKPVTEQPTEAPVTKPVEKKVEETPKEEVKKETPTPPKVLYPGKKDGESAEAKNANQGDKTDAVGDQGDKDGNVDARALYGTSGGGGGGSALEMAGWMWDREPDPEETTNQEGLIRFEVNIDDKGQIVSVIPIKYNVSASLMKVYQAEVERLTFSQTSGGKAPPSSKGYITFTIKAN